MIHVLASTANELVIVTTSTSSTGCHSCRSFTLSARLAAQTTASCMCQTCMKI